MAEKRNGTNGKRMEVYGLEPNTRLGSDKFGYSVEPPMNGYSSGESKLDRNFEEMVRKVVREKYEVVLVRENKGNGRYPLHSLNQRVLETIRSCARKRL